MELKWLEDFLSLARNRSFSKAAEERHVTQSAFSRRIQALEQWLGVQLINRSTYPTALTDEGLQFIETAEETVRMLRESRYSLQAKSRPGPQMVSVAALHSLSLIFFPRWFRRMEATAGPIGSRVLPDDFHSCIQALVEGSYDFLLTYHHPHVPIPLDPQQYPFVVIGNDTFVAVHRPGMVRSEGGTIPLLGYAPNSFLGRLAALAQAQAGSPAVDVAHRTENAMADALKHLALEGYGMAWLPGSLAGRELSEGSLVALPRSIPLEIRLYRNARRMRPVVRRLWEAALAHAVTE